VVESTRLESERAGNRTVGSNPTLSAILKKPHKSGLFTSMLRDATLGVLFGTF
jgi:hypothetical protein